MEQIKTVAYLRYGKVDGENTMDLVKRDKAIYAEICEKNGMDLVDVYFDYGSGRAKDRLGFMKLMDDSEKGKFQRVIVKSVSKLNRSTMEVLNIIRQLKENGVSVWLISEGGLIDDKLAGALKNIAESKIDN